MCPAKIQISLRIYAVWSEYFLSAWRNLESFAIQCAPSEDSDQTARCAVWSESSLGANVRMYVFWCRGSTVQVCVFQHVIIRPRLTITSEKSGLLTQTSRVHTGLARLFIMMMLSQMAPRWQHLTFVEIRMVNMVNPGATRSKDGAIVLYRFAEVISLSFFLSLSSSLFLSVSLSVCLSLSLSLSFSLSLSHDIYVSVSQWIHGLHI